MTKGGGIAKKTVTPVDDSVDAATVARWLNCSTRQVRQYAEEGLAVRTGPGRFDLERSVGNVVLHLRELASSRRGADGTDVVKASAALKDAQRKLAELKYQQLDGQLISLPEAETVWSELVRFGRVLFQSLPARARVVLPHLTDADQATLEKVADAMLREIALKGPVPLPTARAMNSTTSESRPRSSRRLHGRTGRRRRRSSSTNGPTRTSSCPRPRTRDRATIARGPICASRSKSIGAKTPEYVSIIKPSRVGFTKGLMIAMAAMAAADPCSIGLLVPVDEDARDYVVDELEPLFASTPILRGLIMLWPLDRPQHPHPQDLPDRRVAQDPVGPRPEAAPAPRLPRALLRRDRRDGDHRRGRPDRHRRENAPSPTPTARSSGARPRPRRTCR